MDALNHADQMRLASLITDNADDVEIQKKIDTVVELTSATRDHAAVALHDCNNDIGKAVDMILEGEHVIENQWKSAGKKRNKQQSQAAKAAVNHNANTDHHHPAHSSVNAAGSHKHAGNNKVSYSVSTSGSNTAQAGHATGGGSAGTNAAEGDSRPSGRNQSHHHHQQHHHQQHQKSNQHHGQRINNNSQSTSNVQSNSDQYNENASESLKNLIGISSANLVPTSDLTTATITTTASSSSGGQTFGNQRGGDQSNVGQININQYNKDASESLKNLIGISSSNPMPASDTTNATTTAPSKTSYQQRAASGSKNQRSTRIPDSAVEMPASKQQVFSLNVQFGELDIGDGSTAPTGSYADGRGAYPDALKSGKVGGRSRTSPNFNTNAPQHQDMKNNRHQLNRGGPPPHQQRRQYNDDKRFNTNNSSNRGRQIPGSHRPYNQMSGQASAGSGGGNSRGVRTILNRGLQSSSTLSTNNGNHSSSGFPDSIDLWTNSTAETANKVRNDPSTTDSSVIQSAIASRVGQWSDVAGNEDWSEEDWDAKVMETKVFTPSSKVVDGSSNTQKVKLTDSNRDEVGAQTATSEQTSQKPINDMFDESVARAVLAQQFQQLNRPLTSSYSGVPTTNSSTTISQVQKSSSGLKDTESSKGIPSVPPGALPVMSQPQYIHMSNAFQPAIFPYAYQAPDVHYQVAPHTAGREQNFQSVYSPNDANKFNRGADGDTSSISTTQSHPFVTNALHGAYQLTYAVPGAYNMMPQNLYSAGPIFPQHLQPQPTNTGSANTVYQKNTTGSYQPHTGYSAYDPLNPLIQDYVKQQQSSYSGSNIQQQQPNNKSVGVASDLGAPSGGNSNNVYGVSNKFQQPSSKQANDSKGYQQQQQQFGFSHNAQHQSSIAYPLQGHNQESGQSGQQHAGASQKSGATQVNSGKYYQNWS